MSKNGIVAELNFGKCYDRKLRSTNSGNRKSDRIVTAPVLIVLSPVEVMNLVCVRLLNEALCSAMRICVVSGYI